MLPPWEVLALNWGHVDFTAHPIRTEQAVQRVYNEDHHYTENVGECKTPASVRTNFMPALVEEKLLKWREYLLQQKNGGVLVAPDAPLFPSTRTWTRRTYSGFRNSYRHFLERNGLPTEDMNLHRFRHTFATLALQNGVDIKTLSGILGHYSSGFTLDTYTHITDKMQQEAAEKMGSFMEMTF